MVACQQPIGLNTADEDLKAQTKNAATFNTQLGIAYLNQGNLPRAKRKLLRALELTPNSSDVNGAMAYYLEKTGDFKKAESYYRKALSLASAKGAQSNNYGTFLCRRERYKEAELYFLKAAQDVQYVHTAGAYENAGLCAQAIPDDAKAKQYFNLALAQDPRRKQSLYQLIAINLKQHQAKIAVADLAKHAKLVANDPSLLALALKVAEITQQPELEKKYKQQLSSLNHFMDTGVKHDYDSNSG